MKTNKLSPDEINGLLGQKVTTDKMISESLLSNVEMEALTELLNVSLGGSSSVLSSLFSEQTTVKAAELSIKQHDNLLKNTLSPFIVVLGEYTGGSINGIQILSISVDDVQTITELMDAGSEATNMRKQFQIVEEVIEQMFASVSQSMATVLEQEVTHSLSSMDLIETQDFPVSKLTNERWFVEADFQMVFDNKETITLHLCIPVRLAKQMVGILTESLDADDPEETQDMEFQSSNQSSTTTKTKEVDSAPNVQSVQFSSFDETSSAQSEPNNLSMLLDIPLQVTVELGRTKRMVKEILAVSQGSIIELDKLAGEPVDILINNKLIAVGEVVVIDENFGVRVTDILSTADRISKLR